MTFLRDKRDWFKSKMYCHIGLPISPKKRCRIERWLKCPDNVAKYGFLPLIHRRHVTHKYEKTDSGNRKRKKKIRHICYATHFDSLIYSFYAKTLSDQYEKWVAENELSDCVIAYRSIPRDEDGKSCKCHIHFANDVFCEIRKQIAEPSNAVGVIVADITGFFDNLDHTLLKSQWGKTIVVDSLPSDHLNVFRNVTHFSYVDEVRLFNLFSDSILTRKTKDSRIKETKVKKLKFMRQKNAIAYCMRSGENMAKIRKAKLIETGDFTKFGRQSKEERKNRKGIPQGLPISAVLANIYMRDFDMAINQWCCQFGATYKRYSDDIVMIVPVEMIDEADKLLQAEIGKVKLQIKVEKTKPYIFRNDDGEKHCISKDDDTSSRMVYLGFSYDGKRILLKDRSISCHYSRMKRGIYNSQKIAENIKNKTRGKLFEGRLIARYTMAGSKVNHRSDSSAKRKFGNYLSYVSRSSSITGSDEIKSQLSRNLSIFNKRLQNAKAQLSKHYSKLM